MSAHDEVEEEPIADLSEPGQEFVICKGGDGGKGNTHFKSSTNRVPRQHTKGYPGEEGWFLFELRTIADIGLVGYPNAGKSTLLQKVSAARPKAAPYPFTTLHPMVGVVDLPEYRRATVADIPGLIEGAHENRGLGHEFLRHIVRCKTLFFVLDMAGSEGRHPVDDYQSLRKELRLYDPTLAAKPFAVVSNKMDLPEAEENLAAFRERFPKVPIILISAERSEGIEKIIDYIADQV
jgi:GTP-binding protein